MQFKNHALIGGGALLGAALILTLGVPRAGDRTVTEVPEPRQVAANTATDTQGPGTPMEEVIRRMEEKYNGRVTEIELNANGAAMYTRSRSRPQRATSGRSR